MELNFSKFFSETIQTESFWATVVFAVLFALIVAGLASALILHSYGSSHKNLTMIEFRHLICATYTDYLNAKNKQIGPDGAQLSPQDATAKANKLKNEYSGMVSEYFVEHGGREARLLKLELKNIESNYTTQQAQAPAAQPQIIFQQ